MHLAGSGILQTSTLPTLRKMVVLPGWPTAPGQGSRGAWGRGGGGAARARKTALATKGTPKELPVQTQLHSRPDWVQRGSSPTQGPRRVRGRPAWRPRSGDVSGRLLGGGGPVACSF